MARQPQAVSRKDNRGIRCQGRAVFEQVSRHLAQHGVHHIGHLRLSRVELARRAPIAQNDNPVRDLEHLTEIMRDVHDTRTARFEFAQDSEDLSTFLFRQGRGRLVHDQNVCFAFKGAGDLDDPLLGNGQVANQGAGRDVPKAKVGQHAAGAIVHVGPIHTTRTVRPHTDVLGHRHFAKDRDFLRQECDPDLRGIARRRKLDPFAADKNVPAVRRVDRRQDLHQGRFAGPV